MLTSDREVSYFCLVSEDVIRLVSQGWMTIEIYVYVARHTVELNIDLPIVGDIELLHYGASNAGRG